MTTLDKALVKLKLPNQINDGGEKLADLLKQVEYIQNVGLALQKGQDPSKIPFPGASEEITKLAASYDFLASQINNASDVPSFDPAPYRVTAAEIDQALRVPVRFEISPNPAEVNQGSATTLTVIGRAADGGQVPTIARQLVLRLEIVKKLHQYRDQLRQAQSEGKATQAKLEATLSDVNSTSTTIGKINNLAVGKGQKEEGKSKKGKSKKGKSKESIAEQIAQVLIKVGIHLNANNIIALNTQVQPRLGRVEDAVNRRLKQLKSELKIVSTQLSNLNANIPFYENLVTQSQKSTAKWTSSDSATASVTTASTDSGLVTGVKGEPPPNGKSVTISYTENRGSGAITGNATVRVMKMEVAWQVNTLADKDDGVCGTLSSSPPSDCSLREAINYAPYGETITFVPGLTGTIGLTLGELVINRRVTVQGPGASVVTLSGNNASRVFFIREDTDEATIEGFTITNGFTAADSSVFESHFGGGIFVYGSSLVVRDCIITGNRATGDASKGGSYGGGIATFGNNGLGPANAFVENCSITNNSSDFWGGGISHLGYGGDLTLVDSTVTGNRAIVLNLIPIT